MSKKSLQYQYKVLETKIQLIHAREMDAAYASAKSEEYENMLVLMLTRHELEDKAHAILRKLNKPSIIKRIKRRITR